MLCDLAKHFPPTHLFGFLPLCQTQNHWLDKLIRKYISVNETPLSPQNQYYVV